MQQSGGLAGIVSGLVGLLLLAAITHAVARRFKLPFTVLLVLEGVSLSAAAVVYPRLLPALQSLQISSSLIFYVFLPTLIFESALNLDFRLLRENLAAILLLAIPGLLLSTSVIGFIVWLTTPFPFTAALLLGAILSATDPVAVVSLFRRLGAPQRLKILVEGESLFNDATAIVLARLLLGLILAGNLSTATISKGALEFLVVFLGGLGVGLCLGLLTGYVLGKLADHFVEITLTTVLAYLSFILAEDVLHVSGVMAVIAAGLTLGGWGRMKVSVEVQAYFDHFWEYMAFIANALIFLMVGLRVNVTALWAVAGFLMWVILALLLSRALVVYGLMPLVGKLPNSAPVSPSYQTLLFWGGLRGAIAMAVVLSLPRLEYEETFIILVTGAVLFTLVIQGLTVEPLMRWLGLDRPRLADRLSRLEGEFAAKRQALENLPELFSNALFSDGVARRLMNQYEKQLDKIKAEIESLHQTEINDEQLRVLLYLRGFVEEESLYVDLFHKGQLGERAFRQLLLALHKQIDMVSATGECQEVQPYSLRRHRLTDLLIRIFSRLPFLGFLAERLRRDRIGLEFEIAGGRYQSGRRVLDTLDNLARVESTPWYIVDKMRRLYQQQIEAAQKQLDQIASRFPELVSQMQERSGRKLLLIAEKASILQQAEHGVIAPPVADKIIEELSQESRRLDQPDIAKVNLELLELLRNSLLFQDILPNDLQGIAIRMRLEDFAAEEAIIHQGEPGNALFFITRGIVRLSYEENDRSKAIATLVAGDNFGETEFLTGKPNGATATAVTPCSLYSLRRDDLEVAMILQPSIRQAIESGPYRGAISNATAGEQLSEEEEKK